MKKETFGIVVLLILISVMFFVCSGCMTTQKAEDFLKKKDKLDDICAENFPVKDSLIKGDSVVKTDTVWNGEIFIDTIIEKDTVRITKTLPPKVITRTIKIVDTVVRRDFAQENVLLDRLRDCDNHNLKLTNDLAEEKERSAKYKKRASKYLWVLIFIAGASLAFTYFKLKRKLKL